ncbi:hypothetical protein ACFX2G_040871 [Malus domestica]
MATGYRERVYLEPSKTPTFSTQEMGRCFDKNPVTTALQQLSLAVLRKKPKGPEDGEPSNQPNRNTTARQPLFPAVLRKKPKGSAIRTPRTLSRAIGENNPRPSENVEDIRRQESREFGKMDMSPASRVSKEVFDISLSLLGDATEKKPSLYMFEQVEKKNPACPTMVLRLSNNAKMDTPAAAMP